MKWGTLHGFSKYEISNGGNIRNIKTGLILKTGIDRYGYEKLGLVSDSGKKFYTTVHRCVAKVFVPNYAPDVRLQVNHIDGNKLNNFDFNLEWATAKANVEHSYTTGLNPNKRSIKVVNVQTNETTFRRSLKTLAKEIDVYSTVLLPLIKHSSINPILGKFIIEIVDEKELDDIANVKNFGRDIHVLDGVTGIRTTYPSVNVAAYHTGLRNLANLNSVVSRRIEKLGFVVSFDPTKLFISGPLDEENILKQRNEYYRTPYKKQNDFYEAYDYLSREQFKFNSLKELVSFLNDRKPIDRKLTFSAVSTSLLKGNGRNGITKGIGIRSERQALENPDWFDYSEAEILRSKFNLQSQTVIYRITQNDDEQIAFGLIDLCTKVGYVPRDAKFNNVTTAMILDSLGDPKLHIERMK